MSQNPLSEYYQHKYENRPQSGRSIRSGIHPAIPKIRLRSGKPSVSFKMRAPFRPTYSKRPDVHYIAAHYEKPDVSCPGKQPDQSVVKELESTPENIISENSTLEKVPAASNPSKAAVPNDVYKDQWWLEYDAYLAKLLK